ncbi:MAG: hypothetical protein IJW45_00850 [Oscillospiraceae bacterium]|nr:hypothetical protein [Oscillospiraceae bacterium]
MEKNDGFNYTYSAAQQQEIQRIRQKYLPHEESKIQRLHRLHRGAYRKARIWSIALGVIGALILGAGMSLVMTDLGDLLQLRRGVAMAVGIAVGLLGLVPVALAYPVYERVLKKEREKIAPEIIRLTDDLLK